MNYISGHPFIAQTTKNIQSMDGGNKEARKSTQFA